MKTNNRKTTSKHCHICGANKRQDGGCSNCEKRSQRNIIDIIESKVERIPESGCWIWLGATNDRGYPQISYKGKRVYVHRLMWELSNGRSILNGMCACHRCDTPSCINPYHIFEGTNSDNQKDCVRKNRRHYLLGITIQPPCGDDHYRAKELKSRFTNKEIQAIINDSRSQRVISKEYGISRYYLRFLKTGNRKKARYL